MIYYIIKLPASLLDVDTRLYSLLSLRLFIPAWQLTVFSLQPGAEAWVPDQAQNDKLTSFIQTPGTVKITR